MDELQIQGLCKGANQSRAPVQKCKGESLGVGVGTGVGVGKTFPIRVLELYAYPCPYPLKYICTFAQAEGRFALLHFLEATHSSGTSSPSAKKLWASRRKEQPSAVTKVMSLPVAAMRRHQEGCFEP